MKKLMIIALGCTLASSAIADTQGFQASLTPDIAMYPRDTHLDGVALSIWGENPQYGFGLGFINGSIGDSIGFSLGLVNYAETVHNGLQLGLVNIMPENRWFEDFPNDLATGMVIVNWSFGVK